MSWPDEPCPACPRRDVGDCRARTLRNARLCELVAMGREDYIALLSRPPDEPTGPVEMPTAHGLPLAGDLVAAATARLGVNRLVKYVADQLGVDCGCGERQIKLNALDARLRKWLGMGG